MNTRDSSGMKAGEGPYREAQLRPEKPPAMRPAPALGSGVLIAAMSMMRLLFAHRDPPAAVRAPSPYVEHARSLAGGSWSIVAVFNDRQAGRDEVLRLPGGARRVGNDTSRAPEILAANGAVAVLPGALFFHDARGELLELSVQGIHAMATPGGVEGRVVQATPGGVARTQDGAVYQRAWFDAGPNSATSGDGWLRVELPSSAIEVAGDDTHACAIFASHDVWCFATAAGTDRGVFGQSDTLRWRSPFPVPSLALPDGEQLVVAGRHACVRGRGGRVACAHFDAGGPSASAVRLSGDVPRATALAMSDDDLCLLGVDGALSCAHGPQEDTDLPLRADVIPLHRALDGVTEVALTEGVGCVRRGGALSCWGALARGAWVSERMQPVPMTRLRDVEALRAAQGLVCALQHGDMWCWGTVQRFDGGPLGRRPRPQRVMFSQPARRFAYARLGLCAELDDDHTRCWSDVGPDAMVYPPPGGERLAARALPEPLDEASARDFRSFFGGDVSVVRTADRTCARSDDGRVACRIDTPSGEHLAPALVPIADVRELVEAHGLFCARRGDGTVWCWGSNASGALTLGESERAPTVVPVRY